MIDFSDCFHANYQAISLIVPYIWYLKSRNCHIEFVFDYQNIGASDIWKKMGARGWSQVLSKEGQNFKGQAYKPLIALRSQEDFKKQLQKLKNTLRGLM